MRRHRWSLPCFSWPPSVSAHGSRGWFGIDEHQAATWTRTAKWNHIGPSHLIMRTLISTLSRSYVCTFIPHRVICSGNASLVQLRGRKDYRAIQKKSIASYMDGVEMSVCIQCNVREALLTSQYLRYLSLLISRPVVWVPRLRHCRRMSLEGWLSRSVKRAMCGLCCSHGLLSVLLIVSRVCVRRAMPCRLRVRRRRRSMKRRGGSWRSFLPSELFSRLFGLLSPLPSVLHPVHVSKKVKTEAPIRLRTVPGLIVGPLVLVVRRIRHVLQRIIGVCGHGVRMFRREV